MHSVFRSFTFQPKSSVAGIYIWLDEELSLALKFTSTNTRGNGHRLPSLSSLPNHYQTNMIFYIMKLLTPREPLGADQERFCDCLCLLPTCQGPGLKAKPLVPCPNALPQYPVPMPWPQGPGPQPCSQWVALYAILPKSRYKGSALRSHFGDHNLILSMCIYLSVF